MGYPDFPIPEQEKSYLPAREILKFLNDYADNFGIRKQIQVKSPTVFFCKFCLMIKFKFRHHVEKVKSVSGAKETWEVTVKNLLTGQTETLKFDAIMICNGYVCSQYIYIYIYSQRIWRIFYTCSIKV